MTNEGFAATSDVRAGRPPVWIQSVISLLDVAIGELGREENPAMSTVLRAASLLRGQIVPQAIASGNRREARMLAWQVRKVREYIDGHLADSIHVEDLSALIGRSGAYFARVFKRTFGMSPYAFVIRRRVELAARCMLETETPLSEIALRYGFADQAHLCKLFRQSTGETPASWRRARKTDEVAKKLPCLPADTVYASRFVM